MSVREEPGIEEAARPREVFASSWLDARTADARTAWEHAARCASLATARGLVGEEGVPDKVYVGRDGSFSAQPHAFVIRFWFFESATGRLYTPETMETDWEVEAGRYPIYRITWSCDEWRAATRLFVQWLPERGQLVTFAHVSLVNDGGRPRDVDGCVVLEPRVLDAKDQPPATWSVAYDGRGVVSVDGRPVLWLGGGASGCCPGRGVAWEGVIPLAGPGVVKCNGQGTRAAIILSRRVEPGAAATWEVRVVSGEREWKGDGGWVSALDREASHEEVCRRWKERVPMRLGLPDARYADYFYSSLHYLLLLKTGRELRPGPREYASFYLHDGVDMVEALDKVGLHDTAREALETFHFKEVDGYLDAIGGCAYALCQHYLLTGDRPYLEDVYSRILHNAQLVQRLRAGQLAGPRGPAAFEGLLPPSVSQDNFAKPAHLYLDNWWSLVGLKSAIVAATELRRDDDVAWLWAEFEGLRQGLLHSIEAVMKREGISFMPACADAWPASDRTVDPDHRLLGGTQIAWAHRPAVCPGLNLGFDLPLDLFRRSYEHYWRDANRLSAYDGAWFVEYEKVFWGYNVLLARPLVYLGLGDIALRNIEWSVQHPSCPGGWMEAMPSRLNADGRYELEEGIIGDVPHGWTAAHYVLLLRDMLVHERDGRLVLLSCVPEAWFAPGAVIEVGGAPTHFGLLDLRFESRADGSGSRVDLAMASPPAGGYLLSLPRASSVRSVRVDGRPVPHGRTEQLWLPPGTHQVEVEYGSPAGG